MAHFGGGFRGRGAPAVKGMGYQMTTHALDNTQRSAPGLLNGLDAFARQHQDTLLLIGRILIGLIFLRSGSDKLMNIDGFAAGLARNGVPMSTFFAYLGAPVEFISGVTIVFGFGTRYAAVLMTAFVIVATLISHRYWEYTDGAMRRANDINFYKNVAIIGGAFYVFVTGSGRYALDTLLRRKG
jgi:putative oxidoreductase